jgi:hypothetical protein
MITCIFIIKIEHKMSLVVKDNSLINASYTLGLVEQRLILLAIIEARETGKGIDTETFWKFTLNTMQTAFMLMLKIPMQCCQMQ